MTVLPVPCRQVRRASYAGVTTFLAVSARGAPRSPIVVFCVKDVQIPTDLLSGVTPVVLESRYKPV
jgi:hypothetical protein